MSAGKHAQPLGLKGWLVKGKEMPEANAKILLPRVACDCSWTGGVWELLGEDDEDTLWCPACLTSGWQYE